MFHCILRRPEVEARCSLSKSTLYELIRVGQFPAPVKLSPNRVGWLESDVQAWLEARVAARAGGAARAE